MLARKRVVDREQLLVLVEQRAQLAQASVDFGTNGCQQIGGHVRAQGDGNRRDEVGA